MTDRYAFYRADLAKPGLLHRDTTDPIDGYYRMDGARTKPSWPVAIWLAGDDTIIKVGNREFTEASTDGQEFRGAGWFKCGAVTEAEYVAAMASGIWPSDGKHARQMDAAERLDIIPDTAASEGGNMLDDDGQPVDQFWAQIKAKLEKAQDVVKAIGKIDTEDKATKLAAQIEIMREAGKLGEAQRKIEKLPWDTGADAVQTKWVPVLAPASAAIKASVNDIDAFQKAERARLQAIADEAARVERRRLQDIADAAAKAERERLQAIADAEAIAENERRQAEAAAAGVAAELVEAKAVEVVAEQVEVIAEQVEAPRVSSAYGRAVTKAVQRKGRIIDQAKFIKAIKGGDDFIEFLQTKANSLARAKTKVAGMEIIEE